MTTAEQLWNDLGFIRKRVREQRAYLLDLFEHKASYPPERYKELFLSAANIHDRFLVREHDLCKLN